MTIKQNLRIRRPAAALRCTLLLLRMLLAAELTFAQSAEKQSAAVPNPADLPSGALVVEARALDERPDRALILWMLEPQKHPSDYGPDDPYTCPDYTRGSHYSGKTRVSLVDVKARKIINTVEIKQEYKEGEDSFDLPYAIRKGYQYRVEGNPAEGEEVKPNLLWLRDYNGDGKALEFALFDAQACMGLATTLIGYSERQDKVIQYPIELKTTTDGKKASVKKSRWCDYLFDNTPTSAGYWKYEVDYRGRGGSLDQYEIRYNQQKELFEGSCSSSEPVA